MKRIVAIAALVFALIVVTILDRILRRRPITFLFCLAAIAIVVTIAVRFCGGT